MGCLSVYATCAKYFLTIRANDPHRGKLNDFYLSTLYFQKSPPPKLQTEEGFSPEFCSFVEQCLHTEASKRPRFNDLMVSFFVNLDFIQFCLETGLPRQRGKERDGRRPLVGQSGNYCVYNYL
jgi:hypothetical protein